MKIDRNIDNGELDLAVVGRLDTLTSPEFEAELEAIPENVERLVVDLEKLDYISSAGLRVLLRAHKIMAARGGMKVKNVNETVAEIFEITGFDTVFAIE